MNLLFKIAITNTIMLFSNHAYCNDFKVALPNINSEISPKYFNVSPNLYILRQLHQTLLISNFDGITSKLLSKWEVSDNYKQFTFCAKNNIYFSNGKNFTISILRDNLSFFEREQLLNKKSISTHIKDNCITLKYSTSYIGLLEELQSMKFAILDPATFNNKIPIGISPYVIDKISENKEITLKTSNTAKTSPYFTKIIMNVVEKNNQLLSNFDEVNLLPPDYIPEKIRNSLEEYKVFSPENTYLLLNNSNLEIRKFLFNCLNRDDLELALDSKSHKITNLYLPKAFNIDYSFSQKCDNYYKFSNELKLTFLSVYPKENNILLRKSFDLLKNNNVSIKIENINVNEAIQVLKSDKKHYDIIYMAIGGYKLMDYFNIFGLGNTNDKFVSFSYKDEKNTIGAILNKSTDVNDKIRKFLSQLNKEYYVLPLAARFNKYYYNKKLKIIQDNSNFSFYEYEIKDLNGN